MEPLRFNSLVEAKEFTNGADKEDIGIPKYGKTFSAVIATQSTVLIWSTPRLRFKCVAATIGNPSSLWIR